MKRLLKRFPIGLARFASPLGRKTLSLRGAHRATKQSRGDEAPSAGDCFASLAMTEWRHDPIWSETALVVVSAIAVFVAAGATASAQAGDGVSVFASSFNDPRGVKFGPDGYLYVAEAGTGGPNSTAGQCPQVPGGTSPGPYTGGFTARISKVSPHGKVTTVIDGLPSGINANNATQGVADIAFIDDELYALVSGGGCSHGISDPRFPAGVYRIDRRHGTPKPVLVANLSKFFAEHPDLVANLDLHDLEPAGTLFSMVAVHRKLYVIEPNRGSLLEINEGGHVRQLTDLSGDPGDPWVGPTAMVFDGVFRVGTLSRFVLPPPVPPPGYVPGAAQIFEITKRGTITDTDLGFTTITGLDLGLSAFALQGSVRRWYHIVSDDDVHQWILEALRRRV